MPRTRRKKKNEAYFKLSKKTISSVVYSVKFTNFFTHTKYYGTEVKSPTFEFAKATWRMHFYPDIVCIFSTARGITVSLVRLNSEEPQQKIFYAITLLDANDGIHEYNQGVYFFNPDNEVEQMIEFSSQSSNHCDTRRNLTMVIHLFCDDIAEEKEKPVPFTIDNDVETLCQDFKELFLNGKNSDLTLKVSGKEFKVHRSILTARSKVFEAMLSHEMTEKNSGVIDITDCDSRAMEQFLFYVYSGKVKILNQENVLGLYYIADKYNMILLREECSEFIKESLSPSNICDVIQFALNHNDSVLLEYATEYFVNHTRDILPTVEWMSFMKFNFIAGNELLIKASKKWDCTQ